MRLVQRLSIAAVLGVAFAALAVPAQAAFAHGTSAPTAARSGSQHGYRHLSEQDKSFLVAAHQSNLAEIAAGHVALAKSHNPVVREIATRLIADHLRLDVGVRATAARHHVALPNAPSREQRAQLAAVARKSGPAFDHAWLKLQESSHVKTLALINRELHQGCAPDVKAVARTAKPVVQMHLEMVREALGED
jgi:putative membrane protein